MGKWWIIKRQVWQKLSRRGNHLACPSKIRVHNLTCTSAHAMANGSWCQIGTCCRCHAFFILQTSISKWILFHPDWLLTKSCRDLFDKWFFAWQREMFFWIDSIENPQVLLPGELQLTSGRWPIALPQTQECSWSRCEREGEADTDNLLNINMGSYIISISSY